MWKVAGCAVIALAAFSAGCSRGGPGRNAAAPQVISQGVHRIGETIFFVDPITPATVAAFERSIDGSVRTLVIKSGGGDVSSGIEMAETIERLGLRVVVAQACWSACAQYVFMAGSSRVIEPNSLVIFHNTASSIARLAAEHPLADSGQFQGVLEAHAKLEQRLYEKLGLPEALLYEPQIEVRTVCVHYVRDSQGRVRDLAFKSPYIGWIPSRQLLASLGISFSGFWPSDLDSLARAFRRDFRTGKPGQIVFGGTTQPMSAQDLDAAYRRIGVCRKGPGPSFDRNAPAWANPYKDGAAAEDGAGR